MLFVLSRHLVCRSAYQIICSVVYHCFRRSEVHVFALHVSSTYYSIHSHEPLRGESPQEHVTPSLAQSKLDERERKNHSTYSSQDHPKKEIMCGHPQVRTSRIIKSALQPKKEGDSIHRPMARISVAHPTDSPSVEVSRGRARRSAAKGNRRQRRTKRRRTWNNIP